MTNLPMGQAPMGQTAGQTMNAPRVSTPMAMPNQGIGQMRGGMPMGQSSQKNMPGVGMPQSGLAPMQTQGPPNPMPPGSLPNGMDAPTPNLFKDWGKDANGNYQDLTAGDVKLIMGMAAKNPQIIQNLMKVAAKQNQTGQSLGDFRKDALAGGAHLMMLLGDQNG